MSSARTLATSRGRASMARIAGVDLPREKMVEVGLTYIFGVGRSTARKICRDTGVDPDTKVPIAGMTTAKVLTAETGEYVRNLEQRFLPGASHWM